MYGARAGRGCGQGRGASLDPPGVYPPAREISEARGAPESGGAALSRRFVRRVGSDAAGGPLDAVSLKESGENLDAEGGLGANKGLPSPPTMA